MRIILIPLLSIAAFAGVQCKVPGTNTNNGTWPASITHAPYRGTCGSGTVHPNWYVIGALSYGLGALFDTAQFDQDMQAVFNDAQLGDTILFTAGQTFYHSAGNGGARITRRPGTGKLLVTTTEWAKLPPQGTRITPAYMALLPNLISLGSNPTSHGWPFFQLVGAQPSADGTHGSADHITFDGLHLANAITDGTNTFGLDINQGGIRIGNGGRAAGRYYTTVTSSTPLVNGSNRVIPVMDTQGFAVTTPRQQIVYGTDSVAGDLYTVEGVDDTFATGSPNITVDRAVTTPSPASNRIFHILNRNGESQFQPDDILIKHCIFDNPILRLDAQGQLIPNSKALTVRDSWFMLHDNMSTEPHIMTVLEPYGPHVFENNYFFGGLTIMYGGAFSSTHSSLAGGGLWRYNYFSLPNEYNLLGQWHDLFDGAIPGFNADQSVDGLSPNSSRFVVAGRGLDFQTTGTRKWWVARNSGVVGTTIPSACFQAGTITGTGQSLTGSYCYDGDPSRPGTTWCPPQGSFVVGGVVPVQYPGDGVCWQVDFNQNAVKNVWESKSSSNQVFQYNLFNGFPPLGTYNTQQVGVVNVKIASGYGADSLNFPSVPDHINGITQLHEKGCRWYTTDTNIPSDAAYDTTFKMYSGIVSVNGTDPNASAGADLWKDYGGYNQWPECNRSYGDHFAFRNNWFRNVWGGIVFYDYYNNLGRGSTVGDYEVTGNLFQLRGFGATLPANPAYPSVMFNMRCLTLGRNTDERTDPNIPVVPNYSFTTNAAVPGGAYNIAFNTCYMPLVSPSATGGNSYAPIGLPGAFKTAYVNGNWDVYGGTRIMAGNIINRYGNGVFFSPTSGPESRSWGEGENIADLFPGTARTASGSAYWGKHIMVGSAGKSPGTSLSLNLGPYPDYVGLNGQTFGTCSASNPAACSVWTDCGAVTGNANDNYINTAPCYGGLPGAAVAPNFSRVFVNPGVDFRLRKDHPFKRQEQGQDPGANPDQLPRIIGLTVTPTDRSVVFEYRLSPVIADIPCVVELHTAPDIETTNWGGFTTGYKGELLQLTPATAQATIQDAQGNNIDSDAHDHNYREGYRRMIILGYSTTLTPDTPHYYRLHCGGDSLVGYFRTLTAVTSTAAQTIVHAATKTPTTKMVIEYGTSYSRSGNSGAGTISGGAISAAGPACGIGVGDGRCSATFTGTRGLIYYVRWLEENVGNTVVATGRVQVLPVF